MKLAIEKWRLWSAGTASRRIFSATLTVFSVSSLVKVIGAAKVLLLARYFGASDGYDAYLVAFILPSFLAEIIAGATSSALIPSFVRAREQHGHDAAQRLLRSILFLCFWLCLAITAAILVFAGPLLSLSGSGFTGEKLVLTRGMLYIMAPILLAGSISAVWRSTLHALGEFAVPVAAQCLPAASIVVAVAVFGPAYGPASIAWGTLAGCLLESAVVAWKLSNSGFSFLPGWGGWETRTLVVLEQYWPVVASTLVIGAAFYVNQAMAATMGTGSVSALNYGTRLINAVFSVGPVALGAAALPQFSLLIARGEMEELRQTLRYYRRIVFLIAAPAAVVLYLISEPLVRIAFQRGAFTEADTHVVAGVQKFYILQLPAVILSTMLTRLLSSLHANLMLVGGAVIMLTANTALNFVLMPRFGVAGIALASSAAAYIYYCYLAIMLFRRDNKTDSH